MDANTQGDALVDRTAQIPPLGDLIKLTGVAAAAFLLWFFPSLFVLTAQDDAFFGHIPNFFLRLSFVMWALFLAPMAFIQVLPWMERYGLNSLHEGKHILWTSLAVFFAFVLALAINYILSYIPILTPEYWVEGQILYGRFGYSGIGFTLVQMLMALFYMAQTYAVLWCSFTLVQKLRGFATLPDSSAAAHKRAAFATKWSFILACSIAIAIVAGAFTFFWWIRRTMYEGSGPSPYSFLLTAFCVYVITFFIAAVLIHAFTANWLPKRMSKVRLGKLFLSFALVYIFMSLVGALYNLLAQWLQNSRSNVLAIILLVTLFIAAIVVCKKVLLDYIRTVWVRVLASLLIFLPTLLLAIKGADDILVFSLLLGLIFSLTTLFLFLVAYSIRLALRIVYGEPDNGKDACDDEEIIN